jgi:hypothetical protein
MTIATSYETLSAGTDDGCNVAKSNGKVSVYGGVPVVQRPYSSAVHATSALSSSSDFGATQLAWAQEVTNTLIGLKIWATV